MNEDEFRIADTFLATALIMEGHEYIDVRTKQMGNDGKRVVEFIFEPTDEIQMCIGKWWGHMLPIRDAQTFKETYNSLVKVIVQAIDNAKRNQ